MHRIDTTFNKECSLTRGAYDISLIPRYMHMVICLQEPTTTQLRVEVTYLFDGQAMNSMHAALRSLSDTESAAE